MSESITPWISAAVTAIVAAAGAVVAIGRRLLSTVTREELEKMMEKAEERHERVMQELEDRQEKKMDQMRHTVEQIDATIRALHEDNKDSRHRLRDDLSVPVNKLNQEIIRLRQSLDKLKGNS